MITAAPTRPVTGSAWPRRGALRRLSAATLLGLALLLPATVQGAAADLSMEVRPLLGGNVRLGAWAAVEVELANDGPAIVGELRLAGDRQGRSSYGMEVDLPTGSRKTYVLYAQPAIFRSKIDVALVVAGATLATASAPITVNDPYAAVIGVVAERPQGIVPDLVAASGSLRGNRPSVVTLGPADLPGRVEAWGGVDRLVWQDVDASQLSGRQADALAAWVAAGGRLVVLGGTTGTSTLGAFPEELLPFRPATTVDVALGDLDAFFGGPAGDAETMIPALTGPLERGNALVTSGGRVVAAQASYGQGSVALIGFDPGHAELAGGAPIQSLWRRILPASTGPVVNPLARPDDGQLVSALGNIPAASLPPLGPLLFLLVTYIVVVGPLNYLLLRRLDRREWAWLTMPAIVLVFAAGSYGLGTLLRGGDVIVNEVGVVRAATGTDRGLAQVYVGVFSPSRQRYDVRVGGGALLSNPVSIQQEGGTQQPLDVLFGEETSRLRGYQVGFGALRGFRAEAPVQVPRISSDLRFVEGRLVGTVTNHASDGLEAVAIVFGDAVAVLGDVGPGATVQVELRVSSQGMFGLPLSERLYGASFTGSFDPESERTRFTRRGVIDALTLTEFGGPSRLAAEGPVLLAWRSAPVLDVELSGQPARTMGQTLYLASLPARIDGPTSFSPSLIRRSVLASDAIEATDQGAAFTLSRGSMTVDFRPIAFEGEFRVSRLILSFSQGEGFIDRDPEGDPISPLPDDQQPPQDDPLGGAVDPAVGGAQGEPGTTTAPSTPAPSPVAEPSDRPPAPKLQPPRFDGLPEIQLFDRLSGRWLEFPHFDSNRAAAIAAPERYVDGAGSVLVRFVNRGAQEGTYFELHVRLDGEIR